MSVGLPESPDKGHLQPRALSGVLSGVLTKVLPGGFPCGKQEGEQSRERSASPILERTPWSTVWSAFGALRRIHQGESSTRSLKAPFKAPLKVSLKALFKVHPPSCTPYCALEGAPLVTLPLALPRMGSSVFLRGALRGTLRGALAVLPQ